MNTETQKVEKLKKTSRKAETREKVARKRGWVPPSNLEAPEPPEGFHHRWVRAEFRGESDEKNIMGRLRSGYEFVMLSEYPDRLDLPSIAEGKYKGVIGVGGLLLAKIPVELAKSRNEYFERKSKETQEAIDNEVLKDEHPSMPITKNRSSKVTFGGSQ